MAENGPKTVGNVGSLLAIDAGREAKFGGIGRYQISQNPGSAAPYHLTLEKIRNPAGRRGAEKL